MEPKGVIAASQPRWIPVAERLPEHKGLYLVAFHPCYWETVQPDVFVGTDSFRGGKCNNNKAWAKHKYQRVTHWMPLPEPPKEVANAGTP